jgi:hypothetical protein
MLGTELFGRAAEVASKQRYAFNIGLDGLPRVVAQTEVFG